MVQKRLLPDSGRCTDLIWGRPKSNQTKKDQKGPFWKLVGCPLYFLTKKRTFFGPFWSGYFWDGPYGQFAKDRFKQSTENQL